MLFVCTENICRSPVAEALLRHHLRQSGMAGSVRVSSAGTLASMPGALPDQRAQKVAAGAGIKLGRIRSSKVSEQDLVQSHFVYAMDRNNLKDLLRICPPEHQHKINLLLAGMPERGSEEVPDPYYASYEAFDEVFHLIERAVIRLIPVIGSSA